MRGPLPQSQKHRANAPTYANVALPRAGRKGRTPSPPAWLDLGEVGLAWWKWAWRTPQATQWDSSVAPLVARRAALEDQWNGTFKDKNGEEITPPASLMKSVLDLDDRLGLSPKALAMLRWSIVDETPADEGHDADIILLPEAQ